MGVVMGLAKMFLSKENICSGSWTSFVGELQRWRRHMHTLESTPVEATNRRRTALNVKHNIGSTSKLRPSRSRRIQVQDMPRKTDETRSGFPNKKNMPFLDKLHLKTIIYLRYA
jgi:hypothetical protein